MILFEPLSGSRGVSHLIHLRTSFSCSAQRSGLSVVHDNVVDGASVRCEVGDRIYASGADSGDLLSEFQGGLEDLLAMFDECDSVFGDGDGFGAVDEVLDTYGSSTDLYVARDCDSPRLVHIAAMDAPPERGTPHTLVGIAALFVEQCRVRELVGGVWDWAAPRPECDQGIDPNDPEPQLELQGRVVSLLESSGDIGPLDPYGTRRIFLAK